MSMLWAVAIGLVLAVAGGAAVEIAAAPAPSGPGVDSLRAFVAPHGLARIRHANRWREHDGITLDSSGVWVRSEPASARSISAGLNPESAPKRLLAWSEIDGIQRKNPDARSGTVLLLGLGISTGLGFAIPRSSGTSIGQSLAISAGVSVVSALAAQTIVGWRPEWVTIYP